MNKELRRKTKNDFGKDFLKLNYSVFSKIMENVRKYRDISLMSLLQQQKIEETI